MDKSLYQNLLATVAKYISITPEEEDFFITQFKPKSLKRKQLILQEGDICQHSIFVRQGCLRGFITDKNGFEHLLSFAPSNWWIADLHSLFTQQPCSLNIEAIENSELLLLPRQNQEDLYKTVPKFERFFRIMAEKSLITHQQRLLDTLSLSAEERYARFCKQYPSLIDALPQKYIAAYIGVTPEFFSKMRSQLLRKM